jgi:hypothetical protein
MWHIINQSTVSCPLDEKLAMIGMTKPNQEQIQMLTDGMEIFVGVLGNVVAGIGQERH